MKTQYLVTLIANGKFEARIFEIEQLATIAWDARLCAFRNLRAWRLLPNQDPQEVRIEIEAKSHTVWTYDSYGNYIEHSAA